MGRSFFRVSTNTDTHSIKRSNRMMVMMSFVIIASVFIISTISSSGWQSVGVEAAHFNEDIDPYEVLEVGRSSSADQIKKAYKRLAKIWHPDKNDDPDAEANFMRISAAYETLSDETKKRDYDRTGSTRSQAAQQHHRGGGGWHDPFSQARFDFQQRFNDYHEGKAESAAMKLTSNNYDHTVIPGVDESILHVWIIYVFADHCQPCERISPIFEEAAKQLRGVLHVGRVHSDFESALIRKLGVRNVPSILSIRLQHGRVVRTQLNQAWQKISAKSIVDWAGTQYEMDGIAIDVLTRAPTTATNMASSSTASVSFAEFQNRLERFVGWSATAGVFGSNAGAGDRVRIIVVSNRSRPHIVFRYFQQRFSSWLRLAHICLDCMTEVPEQQMAVARALGVADLVTAANGVWPFPLLIVHREPGTRPTVLSSVTNDRESLTSLLLSHRYTHMPRINADNFYDICFRGGRVTPIPSTSSTSSNSKGNKQAHPLPLPSSRCLILVSENGQAPSVMAVRELGVWIMNNPTAEGIHRYFRGSTLPPSTMDITDNERERDYIQMAWIDATTHKDFISSFAPKNAKNSRPLAILLKANTAQYITYAPSTSHDRSGLMEWLKTSTAPDAKYQSIGGGVTWPSEDAIAWSLPSLPSLSWLTQWMEDAATTDGAGSGMMSMLLMMVVMLFFMLFTTMFRFIE